MVTASWVLRHDPRVVQVVPLTTRLRGRASEVHIEPDSSNGLAAPSAAQCQHVRVVATSRVEESVGNVGPVALAQIRDTLAVLLDL